MGPIVKTNEQLIDLWTDCFCVYNKCLPENLKVTISTKDIIFTRLSGFSKNIAQHTAYTLSILEPKGTQCEQLVIYPITALLDTQPAEGGRRWTSDGLINACLKKRGLYDDILAATIARQNNKEV